jgi:hypothetical protein
MKDTAAPRTSLILDAIVEGASNRSESFATMVL